MKIVLINAPVTRHSPHASLALPLGLSYLGSALLAAGNDVSATDFKKNLDQILDSGGDYFVPKPFEPEDLAVDLYFLAETDFKPQPHTLSQLRITRSLELERARRSPKEGQKTPEAVVGKKPTEEEAPTEISGEISVFFDSFW